MKEKSKPVNVLPREVRPRLKADPRTRLKFAPELPTERPNCFGPVGWRRLSPLLILSESAVTKPGGTAEDYLSSL